jgi:hypothetical protein
MKRIQTKKQMSWLQKLALSLLALTFAGCASVQAGINDSNSTPVGLTGTQHMGPNFNVSGFYVDGAYGSNVGREGGGGSDVCCVLLPNKWRPGLTAEVRWAVGDWSKENLTETAAGNYTSITSEGVYKALVPVEKYDVPGQLYVHFFIGGRVRVVSSNVGVLNKDHPIQRGDSHAIDNATVGTPIATLFTPEEQAESLRKFNENKKNGGDWR